MKKNIKNIYAACETARQMVENRRRYAPRVVEDKRKKPPKYKSWKTLEMV